MPSFISIDRRIKNIIVFLLMFDSNHHIEEEAIRKIVEPIAWIRKYLSIASDSWNLFEVFIKGIKASIFISNAAHVINKLFLEIAINELVIINEYRRKFADDKWKVIKINGVEPSYYKLEA
jgi:hypothetical protein